MPAPVVAIVGAGQGGFQTAASLREAGFDGRVVLIGNEACLPYERPPLSKSYLAGHSPLAELWLRPQAFYDKEQIDYLAGETVTAIDRPGKSLRLASGREIRADHVVLATGARCRFLPVPGADLDGVLPLRTLADADLLRERLAAAREVVVVGAGFIGLEFAAVAGALGVGVHIVEVTREPMGRVVSAEVSRFYARAHREWGAELLLGTGVARILGQEGKVVAIETDDGRRLSADLVLVCIGVVPNGELAAEAGLAVENGVVVDAALQTADPAGLAIGHDRTVVRGDPDGGAFSIFCFRDGRLVGVESVNRPLDHMIARRLLAGPSTLTPQQAADPDYDLKAHAAGRPAR